MLKNLIVLTLFSLNSNLYALGDDSYARGWYWGEDAIVENSDTPDTKVLDIKTMSPKYTQKDVLDGIKNKAEELKAQAILNPTADNVANYIRAQNRITNMASGFSDGWQKALLLNPELDYTAKNPTNNYARRLLNDEKQQDTNNILSKFSSEYGLVFFFNGKDGISTYQSKVISDFVTSNSISLVPVSMTGDGNQYFKNPQINQGQADRMKVTVTPAVIALNIRTKEAVPLVFGVTTESELADRIYNLYKKGF